MQISQPRLLLDGPRECELELCSIYMVVFLGLLPHSFNIRMSKHLGFKVATPLNPRHE